MTLQYLFCLFAIIAINNGQPVYKQSNDCPGNLKWSKTGKTVFGGKGYGSDPDQLKIADNIFIEPKTQILYIADTGNNRIQKLYPNGQIKTAAGKANGDGGSTPDTLTSPFGVFADENENVYVADSHNNRIQFWKKDANSGKTVAGNGSLGSALNELNTPVRVLLDSKKNILIVDLWNHRVMQWSQPYNPKTSQGTIIAGGNGPGLNLDQLNAPSGLYFDEPHNTLYISNQESSSVTQWQIGPYGERNVYAGIPGRYGRNAAQLFYQTGITFDKYGNLYIADTDNQRIQLFCPNAIDGITIAGTGQLGNSSDEFWYPSDVALDADLNLYVSDSHNCRIQKFERIQ